MKPKLLKYGLLVGFTASSQGASILLEDNFDDNLLDASKWAAVTTLSAPATGGAFFVANGGVATDDMTVIPGTGVVEEDMVAKVTGRAHLNTVADFNPFDYSADGGL